MTRAVGVSGIWWDLQSKPGVAKGGMEPRKGRIVRMESVGAERVEREYGAISIIGRWVEM